MYRFLLMSCKRIERVLELTKHLSRMTEIGLGNAFECADQNLLIKDNPLRFTSFAQKIRLNYTIIIIIRTRTEFIECRVS